MREVGIGNVKLGRRLGVAENEIRRCLDPWHATKINRLEDALASLGRRLIVTVDAADIGPSSRQEHEPPGIFLEVEYGLECAN